MLLILALLVVLAPDLFVVGRYAYVSVNYEIRETFQDRRADRRRRRRNDEPFFAWLRNEQENAPKPLW